MLVLSRKPNEEILIGENIKITVLKVKGNTVRIGIEAPAAVKVKRGELPDAVPNKTRPDKTSPIRTELELRLSFTPSEEGVLTDKETSASRQPASVLKFEPAAGKSGRKPRTESASAASSGLLPLLGTESGNPSQGTNRIKEILSRIVAGAPADESAND